MERYDLYWAKFAYEDSPDEYKVRPVVILDSNISASIGSKVTSNLKYADEIYNYTINDWKKAGLAKQSVVRLKKLQEVIPMDYIGHLSDDDIKNIEKILLSCSVA